MHAFAFDSCHLGALINYLWHLFLIFSFFLFFLLFVFDCNFLTFLLRCEFWAFNTRKTKVIKYFLSFPNNSNGIEIILQWHSAQSWYGVWKFLYVLIITNCLHKRCYPLLHWLLRTIQTFNIMISGRFKQKKNNTKKFFPFSYLDSNIWDKML